MNARHLTTAVLVLVVGSMALACSGAGSPSSSPSLHPTASASPTPVPTPSPRPTPTPTLVPTTGGLSGTLTVKKTGAAVVGAWIVLCKVAGSSCHTSADLVAKTLADGAYSFDEIPSGSYVVFYSTLKTLKPAASNLAVDVNDKSADCIGEAFYGSRSASCSGSTPFSDDAGLKLEAGGTINISLGNSETAYSIDNGAVTSPKYGLTLVFVSGKPLSVDVAPGLTATLGVETW
jgi:hypothetical protein